MVMDLIILGIFALCIVICMVKGFARTVIGFLKGIVSLVVSWIFCDDLADYLITQTKIGANVEAKINAFLSTKWEDSSIYNSLPDLFKGSGNKFASTLISDGSSKLSVIFITIACFIAIWLGIKLVLGFFSLLFSKKHRDGLIKKTDTFMGFIVGIVIGAFYVYLFLALLVPVTGFLLPGKAETIMGWFEGARVAKWLYDNNLLLIVFRDFILKL